jgi:hypothetical protein
MALILLNPPVVEPVSLAELKDFLQVDAGDTSQDDVILALEMAARAWAETYTSRRFVQQTWRLLMDFFPGYIDLKLAGQKVSSPFVSGSNAVLVGIRYAIVLPYPPVRSLVLFQYLDANGNVTVMNPATDFTADLQSNPARLTPPFGRMWPVARVVVNAIQVDFTMGYAMPVVVSAGGSPPNLSAVTANAYMFAAADVGRPISIPAAGPSGRTLNTVIASISSPPDSNAILRDPAAQGYSNQTALLVNAPSGNPAHWGLIKSGIKMLVNRWFDIRMADENDIPAQVKAVLAPVRDFRF